MTPYQDIWSRVEPAIRPTIEALAAERSAAWSKVFGYGLLVGFGSLVPISIFVGINPITIITAFAIGFFGMYYYYQTERNKKYKAEVMPQMVKAICPGATYKPKGNLDKDIVTSSKLYDFNWGRHFEQEDYICGKVGKTKFVYSEIEIWHTESNGKSTRHVTDFKGFIFEADFNKHFNGVTMLSTQGLRLATQVGLFSDFERLHLEDVNFDERYRCYGTNDQEARYILSPALQLRILDMHDVFRQQLDDNELEISFHNGRMLIMVPSSTNRFEVKYTTDEVKSDILALAVMIDIVEMLNLNLRIWTKE